MTESAALREVDPETDDDDHALDAVDANQRESADNDELCIAANREFNALRTDALIRQSERGEPYAAGAVRIRSAREPWADMAANPEPLRYLDSSAAQLQLEEHYARSGLDDRTLSLINESRASSPEFERSINCGECARALAATLNGQPEVARPLLLRDPASGVGSMGEPEWYMEEALQAPGELGRTRHGEQRAYDEVTFERVDPEVAQGFRELESELLRAGDRSHAVVEVSWKPPPGAPAESDRGGHWFNMANVDGRIMYLDAQQGEHAWSDTGFALDFKAKAREMAWIRAERP